MLQRELTLTVTDPGSQSGMRSADRLLCHAAVS
jgi:hypothetical protein